MKLWEKRKKKLFAEQESMINYEGWFLSFVWASFSQWEWSASETSPQKGCEISFLRKRKFWLLADYYMSDLSLLEQLSAEVCIRWPTEFSSIWKYSMILWFHISFSRKYLIAPWKVCVNHINCLFFLKWSLHLLFHIFFSKMLYLSSY